MLRLTTHGMMIMVLLLCGTCMGDETIRVLLIDGQNNHAAWPRTSPMIKKILEECGLFQVDLSRTPKSDGRRPNYGRPQPTVADMPTELQAEWARWRPDFDDYDVVVKTRCAGAPSGRQLAM